MASFDENGKYIKTNWKAGDKITATKLNKIEESIEAVNDNDISRHVEADTRLDALEAKDVAHDKELTSIKNTIADNKAAAELGDYEINSRMTFLEQELNEGIEEVHNVAETVDGKIAKAESEMNAIVSSINTDLDDLFQSVSNGKALVASAITDKGVITASDATFQDLANNISLLSKIGGFIDDTESNNIFMYGYDENVYTLKYEDTNGPLESFGDIGTISARTLSNGNRIYENKDLINYNIAPYSATKIGAYDSNGVKVTEIPLEKFKPGYGDRLYRFGLLSDVHNNAGANSGSENASSESREDLERALKFFNDKESVWATCIAGDLTDTGAEDQLQIYKTNVDTNSPNTPVYACAGNHDCRSNVSDAIWEQYTGNKRCFEITKGNDHFLFFGMSKESMGPSGSPYTQENIDWLRNKLDKYRNERCFIFMHLFFPDRSGNLKRLYTSNNWLGGNQLTQIQSLSDHYRNTVWFSGHSHWKWSSQMYEQKANVWKSDTSGWCVHVPSCAIPKYIANANAGTSYAPLDSEGAIIDVYDNYIDIRAMDLKNGKYLPIGHYRLDTTLVSVASTKTIDDVMDELFWVGVYIDSSTGQLSDRESGYATTCYTTYDADKIYTLKLIDPVGATRVFYYDSNKVFISCTAQLATREHELTVPPDTAYIRVRTRCNGVAVDDVYDYVTLTSVANTGARFDMAYDELHWFDIYIASETGEVSSSNTGYATSAYINYDSAKKYTITLDSTVTATRVFYYDSNKVFMSCTAQLATGEHELTVPPDTAYIRVRTNRNGITVDDVYNHVTLTTSSTSILDDVYDKPHWFNAYIDSNTGELSTDSNPSNIYATTAFISYNANKIYKLVVPDTANQTRIFYYDSNKTFMSCTNQSTELTHTIDSVPDGTAYLRFRTRTTTEVSDYETFVANITCTITQRPTYNVTNIVPTLESTNSTAPFDGVGYRNNAYISSSSNAESSHNGFVLTGLIPISVTTASASTIYVRGVTMDTTNSYTRLSIYDSNKQFKATHNSTGIAQYYITEELSEQYYKLTPAYAASTGNTRLSGYGTGTLYVRFSFTGVGENLVMTLDQPIN